MGSLDCEVCLEDFDEGKHLPRCLTCGHTLCTSCVHRILLKKAPFKCPFCRTQPKIFPECPEELPVNYSVLKALRGQKGLTAKVISSEKPECCLKCVKEDISTSADNLLCELEDDLDTLRRLHKRLDSKEHAHAQRLVRISGYITYLKKVGLELNNEKKATKKAIAKGEAKLDGLRVSKERLKTSKTLDEMSEAHQSIVRCHTDIDEWRERVQHFHYSDVIKKYKAVKRVTLEALSLVPVKQEESSVRDWMDGRVFLLYTVAFVCGIVATYWKAVSNGQDHPT